jgi:N-acetylmuramoyl-L-alanine amidase
MTIHVVQRGEHLSKIARRYGFKSYQAIYDHPDNAELKRLRPDPNLIFPGDKIVIPPEPELKLVPCATGSRHTFEVKLRKKHLKVVVRDPNGSLLRNEPFRLEVPGEVIEGKTDGDGMLDQVIPDDAARATLTVRNHRWDLFIGDLTPSRTRPTRACPAPRRGSSTWATIRGPSTAGWDRAPARRSARFSAISG